MQLGFERYLHSMVKAMGRNEPLLLDILGFGTINMFYID